VEGKADLDIIVTSPPYGDNATTVPYGQYSYLPLQWVDLKDIDDCIDNNCLASTHEIDIRSLGGSKRVKKEEADYIQDRSPTFRDYIKSLDEQPRDRAIRVTAFFRDLDGCLDPILKSLRPGGLMVWTLGNRMVGGKSVPLDDILSDMLQAHDAKLMCKLTRRISSKRMAPKNNIADTMSSETILVMRKAV
jgi:site-specific DNA-methyltransferase (cytosine-N4-specific)